MGFFRFLKSLRTLARNGDITIDEAYKFAKQEFGEVSDLLKLQINKIFKDADAPSIKLPKKGEVVKLPKETPNQESGISFSVPERGIFNQETSIDEVTQMLTNNPFRPGGSLDQVTGITRGLARKILTRRGIEIGKNDPIEVFIDTFGESITDVKNLAEEMVEADSMGRNLKSPDELLEIEGLFDIEIPKNPNKGLTDDELLELMKKTEEEEILKDFDVTDREPNAAGGLSGILKL